jgi:hypothetical protein
MDTSLAIVCLVIFLVVLGLASIFARDLMWELTHMSNQMAGKASERTELWDTWSVIGGVVMLIVAAVVVLAMGGDAVRQNQDNAERTQVAATRAAEDVLLAGELDETFTPAVNRLVEQAETYAQRITPRALGLTSGIVRFVDYGICPAAFRETGFYMFLVDYRGSEYEVYAYFSDDAYDCRPDGWFYSASPQLIGSSRLGGNWYRFQYVYAPAALPDVPATRTAAAVPTVEMILVTVTPDVTATRMPRPSDGR